MDTYNETQSNKSTNILGCKKIYTGWRVMPEDEKIKLAQESKVIGQVLGRIRSMRQKEGGTFMNKL